jgi:hypothetical protein
MEAGGKVAHVERVCCLECGTNYVKPAGGSTAHRNPGCPRCGYVGWISALVPPSGVTTPARRHRSGGDPPRTPAVQQR